MRRLIVGVSMLILVGSIGSRAGEPQRVMNFIAVADIEIGKAANPNLSATLTNVIIDELVNINVYTVIDRANRDKILAEQGFQQSCHVGECVVEMGRLLGVGKMVVGNLDKVKNLYVLDLKIINVESMAIEASVNESYKCKEYELVEKVRLATKKLIEKSLAKRPPTPPPTTVVVAPPPVIGPVVPQPPIQNDAGTGASAITTNPPGAEVFLDAQPVGKTPLTISKVEVGVHQLTIIQKGYSTLTKNVEVQANQTTQVSEILSQQTGAIEIQSTPAGADCWVDGKYIGKTPRKIPAVLVGKHAVKITLSNYTDFTGETNVAANETTVVNPKLVGLPGRILVTSVPDGADVFIDGKKVGVTPYNSTISAGSHQVRVGKAEYQSAEQNIVIESNKPKAIEVILKKGPDIRVEMVVVPAGEFTMGSDSGEADEKPVHRVYLDAFYIDKYEVTNAQYQKCVDASKCRANEKYDGFTDPKQPVVGVDWDQSAVYCAWAGKRLPTEAEWEKAARGNKVQIYPWGNRKASCSYAVMNDWNFDDSHFGCRKKSTWPVGSKPTGASPYGAMDMAGNVWEWTADSYDQHYYPNSPSRNPTGPASGLGYIAYRVVRGGSWDDDSDFLRASCRGRYDPGYLHNGLGFRCARSQ